MNTLTSPPVAKQPAPGLLPWIDVAPHAPYFVTEHGEPWTPIGQNDSICWVDLEGLLGRRDLPTVEAYLQMLVAQGVTVLRVMMEYAHFDHHYFEEPAGEFSPGMVHAWDDLFTLCAKYGLRILLTPYDTFWMWLRWENHPYNAANGGPCADRATWLVSQDMRVAIKRRLAFATERWGGSGVLFAWDLWNEIHPEHSLGSPEPFGEFVQDIGGFLRAEEIRLHGRAHPQTVSIYGEVLENYPAAYESIFRHPALNFASPHIYKHPDVNAPSDTLIPAFTMGSLVRRALHEIRDGRPYFDSEHGPIHTFHDMQITLPEEFDDEYFRHMQWAHLASGGAGGGMRWPNRHPHTLTRGMRRAQLALARFLPLIDWTRFRRRNWSGEFGLSAHGVAGMACGDEEQAVVWLVRTDTLTPDGTLRRDAPPRSTLVHLPLLGPGDYRITVWDTLAGVPCAEFVAAAHPGRGLHFTPPAVYTDLAVAVRRI